MSNYRHHHRYKKGYKDNQTTYSDYKMLFVSEDNELFNCWRFTKYYEKIDGKQLSLVLARGEGEIVRHLCSDGRCVNPLHLVRGTHIENAKDEIEVRDFEVEMLQMILNDYSMKDEDKALAHLTLIPRFAAELREKGMEVKYLSDANKNVRELFRLEFIKKFIINHECVSEDDINNARQTLNWLKNRSDIKIIKIPGGSKNE